MVPVGIGTTAPAKGLHVESGSDGGARAVRIAYDGTYYFEILQLGASGVSYDAVGGTPQVWMQGGAEKMRIHSDGKVGIGTASPSDLLSVAGNTSLMTDGAVLKFGADQDVTLTHVHDTGLLLNGAMQLQFSDASQYINAPSATVLDINATDEIELNATLVDINANVEISGTATTTGVHTFTAVPVLPANSIDSDHYVDGSIDNAHIADDAIDSEHYVDGSIDNAHIADDAIDSEHYAADSIDEEHIANDAVGSAELKTLSTLLIKDSSGSTLKTLYGAGA